MKTKKKKMEFLAKKLSSLQAELEVSKSIFQEAISEVKKLFSEKYSQPKKQEVESKEITNSEKVEKQYTQDDAEAPSREPPENIDTINVSDPQVKKLFKKIALQCHPDKLAAILSEEEKTRKKEIYIRARRALEENDLISLSACASELKIEIPEVTTEQLREAEKKISDIKKEINTIESTLVWHWFFTENKEKKESMLKKIFELMHAQNTRS